MGIKLPQICYGPMEGPGPGEASRDPGYTIGEQLYRIRKKEMEQDFRRSTGRSLVALVLVISAIVTVSFLLIRTFE